MQDALKLYAPEVVKAAEATGQLIDPMEAIAALAKSYEDGLLTETKLAQITSSLGGKLRASQLLSLIQNYSGMYTQMMRDMGNAIGAVDKDVDKAAQSWKFKLNSMKTAFAEFTESILDTDAIKGFIDAMNYLIQSIDNPEEFLDKFSNAFETAIHSLVEKLPRIQGAISQIALTLVKSLLSALASEAPTILKSITDGARTAADELAKELPDIMENVMNIIGTLLVDSIVNGGIAQEIGIKIVDAIIEAIPNAINGLSGAIGNALEDGSWSLSSGDDAEALDSIMKFLGLGGAANAARSIGIRIGKDLRKGTEEGYKNESHSSTSGSSHGGSSGTFADEIDYEALALKRYENVVKEYGDSVEDVSTQFDTFRDKVDGATKSIKKYTDALAEGEKGDKLKSYSEAYKKAVELAGKGLTGSNAFMSAVDLLFTPEQMRELGWSYEKAAKELSKPFFKAMFEGGGEDFGANAANYIRTHPDEFEGVVTELTEDGKFSLMVTDMDAFAKSANMSADALYVLLEALGAYNSSVEYTKDELDDFVKKYGYSSDAYKKLKELSEGGNVQLWNRPKVSGKTMQEAGWNEVPEDSYATVYSSTYGHDNVWMNFTPILPNGEVLSPEALADYASKVVDGAEDKLGLKIGGTYETVDEAVDAAILAHEVSEAFYDMGESVDEAGNKIRTLNLKDFVTNLARDGKTEKEIHQIVYALQELAKTDPTLELEQPEEKLDDLISKVVELEGKTEEDNKVKVDVESDVDEEASHIKTVLDELDGTTINAKVKIDFDKPYGFSKGGDPLGLFGAVGTSSSGLNSASDPLGIFSHAQGTNSSAGGLALVNDGGGAEIIASDGMAWIAGGGKPVITNVPAGATVFNAKQTREILSRSGIPAFDEGTGWFGGIPIPKSKSGGSYKLTKNLEAILDELGKYIDKILKKAKDALDAQLKAIDAQIEALEREHNAEEDKNKLEELRLKVLEAEKRLVEAQNERTVRYFNKETGQWEWMADQKAVYEAEQALKEAQEAYDKEVAEQAYQAQIQALKDLKEALQGEYDNLADYWEQIVNTLKESSDGNVDIEKLLKSLGLDSGSTANIRELIKSIQEYEKKLASGSYDMPLDSATTNRIMGAFGVQGTGTNSIGQVFGISTADSSARGSSIYSSSASSVVGDTIYYINGWKIGSDMMDKPLSEILSRLSIYAN